MALSVGLAFQAAALAATPLGAEASAAPSAPGGPGWFWQGADPRYTPAGSSVQLDGEGNVTLIDLGLCATTAGTVHAAEAFVDASALLEQDGSVKASWAGLLATMKLELWLQVWRPGLRRPAVGTLADLPGTAWRLVTQVHVEWTAGALQRLVVFNLTRPLPLSAGDCVGWHTGMKTGIIPFSLPPGEDDGGPRPGVIFKHGTRVARCGGDEVAQGVGWAPGRYALRIWRGPLPSPSAAPPHPVVVAAEAALPPPADAFIPRERRAAVCDLAGLPQAGCPELETSQMMDVGPIDWRAVLQRLCLCTAGGALVGGAVATAGSCCDLNDLDRALFVAGHPNGVRCLHAVLAILAACSGKLSLRHRGQLLPPGVASVALQADLKLPKIGHAASPVRLLEVPATEAPAPEEDGQLDLELEPVQAGKTGQKHTYRIRGPSSGATFAPFPFGSRDLLWWLQASPGDELSLLTEVLLGLTTAGVPAMAFEGSLRRLFLAAPASPALKEPMDILVPWASRESVTRFAVEWRDAALHERHLVDLPLRLELGVLPDAASIRPLWPSDLGFRVVCPGCAYVVIFFHFAPADGALATTRPGAPCAWPAHLVLPLEWRSRSEILREPGPVGCAQGTPWAVASEGSPGLAPPELPWPAQPHQVLAFAHKHREGLDGSEQASLGACWPSLSHAADAEQVPRAALGFARVLRAAPAFDMSPSLRPGMGFYDLYDLRREVELEALGALVDKVALKQRLQADGLPTARVFHASYESPEIRSVIQRLGRYVVKAAHRHHGGRGVVLVADGRELKSGRPISVDEVQAKVYDMWPRDPLAGEVRCIPAEDGDESQQQCVTNAPKIDKELRPAIIVEELAVTWDGRRDVLADEAFCFAAWARVCICGVMGASGVWAGYFSRDGTPIYGLPMHKQLRAKELAGAAMQPPIPWPVQLREDVVALVERAAENLGADFVRVDVFPNGGSPLVAEVSIVSGWLGRNNLHWGEVDAWLLGMLGERWLEGYGQVYGRLGPEGLPVHARGSLKRVPPAF